MFKHTNKQKNINEELIKAGKKLEKKEYGTVKLYT